RPRTARVRSPFTRSTTQGGSRCCARIYASPGRSEQLPMPALVTDKRGDMEHQPWICPACNRRLPRWIYECRCGFQRDPEDPVEAGQGPAVNATATSRARLFAGGIVLAVTVSAPLWGT